jgi:hypothetical protein
MSLQEATHNLLAGEIATGQAFPWPGGMGSFSVYAGTFNGATVKLQWSPDNGSNWLDVDRHPDIFVTLTEPSAGMFELPPCPIRAAVVGGPPSAIYANAKVIFP